jgi:hypothetical protein
MTIGLPEKPTFRSIILGISIFVILLLAFIKISDVVKFGGTALMYIPAKLGLIDMVTPKEVIPLPLETNPSFFTVSSPGQYVMYLNNLDMLVVHDAVAAKGSDPWMNIQSEELGSQIKLTLIERGLSWYDTPFARGRPVVTFKIEQPGTYQFTHPVRQDYMYLVPDNVTGKETRIAFWVIVEIALIGGVAFYIYRRRTESARKRRSKILAENRARVEDTWKGIEERRKQRQIDEDKPYWKK